MWLLRSSGRKGSLPCFRDEKGLVMNREIPLPTLVLTSAGTAFVQMII